MARQPRGRRRAARAGSPVPLIIFITLFVFAFVGFVLMLRENYDLRDQIEGGAPAGSHDQFRVERPEGQETKGYLFMLARERAKLQARTQDYYKLMDFIGIKEDKNVAEYTKHIAEMRDQLGIRLGEADVESVKLYTDRLEARAQELQHRLDQANDAKDEFNEKREQALTEKANAVKAKEDLNTRLNTKIGEQDDKYTKELADRDKEITSLREGKSQADEKHQREMEKLTDQVTKLGREKQDLEARIAQLLEKEGEEFNPQTAEIDGKVLVVNLEDKTVMIDVGRGDGGRKGVKFDVYEEGVGGVRRQKGQIEIRRVHDQVSYASILKMGDDLDPILRDNILISPAFQRGRPMVFTIEPADFDKTEVEVLRTKLQEFGNKIVPTPSVEVRYCIVGNKPAGGNRPIAEKCAQFGIPSIKASDLHHVLGEY